MGSMVRECHPADIITANERIVFLAERARASAELTVAMAGEDLSFLQWAVSSAESSQADEHLLEDAKKKLAGLESKARSEELFKMKKAAQLRAAVFRSGKLAIGSGDFASQDVRNAGFGIRVIKPTGEAEKPGALEAKIAARGELQGALNEGAANTLDGAVRKAMRAGLCPAEIADAHRSLRYVSTDVVRSELAALRRGMARLEAATATGPAPVSMSRHPSKTNLGQRQPSKTNL